MLPITQDLLTSLQNRPWLREPSQYNILQLKGVVMHWTANTRKGADAKANRNYFNTTERYASAHYIVDDQTIIQCIPDHELAYHVGGSQYKADGDRIRVGDLNPNYFLIGIEMCVNEDGIWAKTYTNAAQLAASLLFKYGFTIHDLYRHFDITGKDCPKMMLTTADWSAFKQEVNRHISKFSGKPRHKARIMPNELNVRSGPGTQHAILQKLPQNTLIYVHSEIKGDWCEIRSGRWVATRFLDIQFSTVLTVTTRSGGTPIRKGAGITYPLVGYLPAGVMVEAYDKTGDWLKIHEGQFINMTDVQIMRTEKGLVTAAPELNVRQGPGTQHKLLYRIPKGTILQILDRDNNWLRIGYSEWVYAPFVEVMGTV